MRSSRADSDRGRRAYGPPRRFGLYANQVAGDHGIVREMFQTGELSEFRQTNGIDAKPAA
ncbi:hypothetical protein [Pelagibius sp.]|uniref:hypothetical protein n=1 Tax=Pelagibius sp. TaxID=1931238 RepID=UPI00262D7031|nr:hypothetical protein [Pelagibius sp.]